MYANARSVFDHARSDLDEALTYRCELSLGQRTGLRNGGAHAMHEPERRGVEDQPHLIGGRVMARHAVREELRLVQFDQVLHLPALTIDVLVKMLRRAFERGDDITDVNLLAHAGRGDLSAGVRLQRALQSRHYLARTIPAAGLIEEARIGAQLGLIALGMMEAQIVGGLGHQGIEYGIAGEAENIVGAVAFRPFHLLNATVMAVAPPHDAGVRPVFAQAFGHVLDDTPDLRALGRARRTKDGDNRGAARNMIDVHRRKAALIMMGVPERKLLAAMRCAEGVIDVEDLNLARPHGGAELVNESCTQPRRLGLARCILKAADGRLRGQRSAALWTAPNRKLHQRIMTQPIEAVSIFVAAGNRRYPRHHHFEHLVSDAIRIP